MILFGPPETGKSRFFDIIIYKKHHESNMGYQISNYYRIGQVSLSDFGIDSTKNFVLIDMPGIRERLYDNQIYGSAVAGITFFHLTFSESQAKQFYEFFKIFLSKCNKNTIIFVIIQKHENPCKFKDFINSYLAKTMEKGAIILDENEKDLESITKQILTLSIENNT